ncbi:MAG: TIGR02453 family protein [Planctomycetes bacterium]|nr:TIGR02453 family protein [Planctomycetota bacterium]
MFTKDTLAFLKELADNNNREWFKANKKRFDESVQAPALEFVREMAPRLKKISKELTADDRKVGGSLMRIYRDVRFSKDKTPYNTHVAFRFVGGAGLGCYLGIEGDKITLGSGIWHPEKEPLLSIRNAIAADGAGWAKASGIKGWELGGESLSRPPQGFDKEHPHINEIKRKDFVLFRNLKPTLASRPGFADCVAKEYEETRPLLKFLAKATGQKF